MPSRTSPFLLPGTVSKPDDLAVLYLKRDHQIPTLLRAQDDNDEGYAEGKVTNTRFGSFPHSTLIGLPWGSQVRASKVDTGSRGRRQKGGEKRKRDDSEPQDSEQREDTPTTAKEVQTATSGFIHLLAPTPENWTLSLPHRTQVVYTPDYSYVLQRLRARPGTSIIEAGAGSGSFTHASARAVYSGYPSGGSPSKKRKLGKVWSYEFHEQRHEKLMKEVEDHGLQGIVEITHRDVCESGFLVDGASPGAEAIFLDLPAPWLALPHLTRRPPPTDDSDNSPESQPASQDFVSALNPDSAVYLCTFSPCIEQVQRTVSSLRKLGWVGIEMVEVAQKRLEVRRDRFGISNGSDRNIQSVPASVDEAVGRLREVEGRFRAYHDGDGDEDKPETKNGSKRSKSNNAERPNPNNRASLLEGLVQRKLYKEGRLGHRTESEVKTHTSYLVFAVLPREWSQEDEDRARERWAVKKPNNSVSSSNQDGQNGNKRPLKKNSKQAQKAQLEPETTEVAAPEGDELVGPDKLPVTMEDGSTETAALEEPSHS